jgi:hypothetical protein
MSTKGWVGIGGAIAAASLIAIVGGCMKPLDDDLTGPCNRAHDCIPIFVDSSTGTPTIKLNPTDVEYERSGNGAIFWQIDSSASAYTFADDNAITFSLKSNGDDPAGEFPNCKVMPQTNNQTFKCSAKGKKGRYGYTITLAGTPSVAPYDPWVINN